LRGVMWHVISFLLRLFIAPIEPSCFASSVATLRGYKDVGCSCTTDILPHDLPSSPCLVPYD
jgi:hypothetical protein